MMDMKLVKSIRAVSPLIAAIILIAITVAGGLVTYALFTSTAGVSSAKGQVSFESVDLVRTGEQSAFAATLKNAGNKPVENITVSLH
jgi:flagellin-like protein